MKKTLSVLLVMILLVSAIPFSGLAMENPFGEAWVKTANGKTVNARRTPTTNADNIIYELPYGFKVMIIGYEKNAQWALCDIGNGVNAYIMTRYLSRTNPGKKPTPTVTPQPTAKPETIDYSSFRYVTPYTAYVRPSSPTGFVNMRWAPSKSVQVIAIYYQGSPLTVIAQGHNWCQVRDEVNGFTGFMMSSFLTR